MTARRVWPLVFAAGAVVGVVAAWLNLVELRASLRRLGGGPVPPPRRAGAGPFDWEHGW